MFRSLPRSSAVWTAVWLSLTAVGSWPLFGQEAAPPAKAIAWRDGRVKEAFVLALEENKRLVVAFLGAAAEKGRPNWSDRFSHELDRLELGRWADKAVFVRVRLVPQGEAGGDQEAQTMASKLKFDGLPLLSIIESRTDHLFESKRLSGFAPASEIPYFLDEGLAQANDLPVPEGAGTAIPAVPLQAPPAATPREALREYVEGTRKADLQRLERVMAARFAEAFNERLGAGDALYGAKRRLLRALDAQFGHRADELPQGDDCEELYAEMRQLAGAKVLSERQEGENVSLEVEFTFRRSRGEITRTETMLAIPDGESWRLLPTAVLTAPDEQARRNAATRKYAASLEQLADEVLAGKWAVRAIAKEMAAKHYETAFAVGEEQPAAAAPATEPAPGPAAAAAAPAKLKLSLPTKEELTSMRALPAVYRIRTSGKNILDYPREFTIDASALLAAYEKDLAAGTVPPAMNKADYLWSQASENFGQWVKASAINRGRAETESGGHGTGFAVGRDGILLTNAHVVDAPKDLPLDAEMVLRNNRHLEDGLRTVADELLTKLGQPSKDLSPIVAGRLLDWFGMQCRLNGEQTRIFVEMAYETPRPAVRDGQSAALDLFGLTTFPARKPIYFEARVLAKGNPHENYNAKDLAILQITDVKDRLVTLALAQRDDVRREAPVSALGFPGWLDAMRTHPDELFLVHVAPGKLLSVPQPPVKGFEQLQGFSDYARLSSNLIQISCHISEGMSGGPVVSESGQVVGLNVIGYDHLAMLIRFRLGESKYAVPIWNAKQMLDGQGIKLEASPLATLWEDGLALYRAGKFAAAEARFCDVARQQIVEVQPAAVDAEGNPIASKPHAKQLPAVQLKIVHRYVEQMIALCAERQGK